MTGEIRRATELVELARTDLPGRSTAITSIASILATNGKLAKDNETLRAQNKSLIRKAKRTKMIDSGVERDKGGAPSKVPFGVALDVYFKDGDKKFIDETAKQLSCAPRTVTNSVKEMAPLDELAEYLASTTECGVLGSSPGNLSPKELLRLVMQDDEMFNWLANQVWREKLPIDSKLAEEAADKIENKAKDINARPADVVATYAQFARRKQEEAEMAIRICSALKERFAN